MEKNFWKDVAKGGATIGVILALSSLLETRLTLSLTMRNMYLLMLEFIVVVVLHYYLLHRFTKERSRLFSADEGFSFGQGYLFVLTMSAFAGVIVGCVQYVYEYLILGYENYVERLTASLNGMMDTVSEMGGGNAWATEIWSGTLEQMQNAPVPSLGWAFVGTLGSNLWTCLLFGAVFGLIIAGVLMRAPKPFRHE